MAQRVICIIVPPPPHLLSLINLEWSKIDFLSRIFIIFKLSHHHHHIYYLSSISQNPQNSCLAFIICISWFFILFYFPFQIGPPLHLLSLINLTDTVWDNLPFYLADSLESRFFPTKCDSLALSFLITLYLVVYSISAKGLFRWRNIECVRKWKKNYHQRLQQRIQPNEPAYYQTIKPKN